MQELGAENFGVLIEEIKHFTEKEARKRDEIVLGYFGRKGVNQIVNAIVDGLNSPSKLGSKAQILDVGAGSGFFTVRITSKLRKLVPNARFYAMDSTPAMLLNIAKRTKLVVPFFGIAENIYGSMQQAVRYADLPERFDAVFSTLMLHHCPNVGQVFRSIRQVMKPFGKAVVVDLCTHSFTEFRQEMGDFHLGFNPEQIEKAASRLFSDVRVKKLPGICCESSGRRAELFVADMKP